MRRAGGPDKAGSSREFDPEAGSPGLKGKAEREPSAGKGRGETIRIVVVMFVVVLLFNAGNLMGLGHYIVHEDGDHEELMDLRRSEERDHQEVSQLETTVDSLKSELARLKDELKKHEEKQGEREETELQEERAMVQSLEERMQQHLDEELSEELDAKLKQLEAQQGTSAGAGRKGMPGGEAVLRARPRPIQGVHRQSADCELGCADAATDCAPRARQSACATEPLSMEASCRLTCGLCRPCDGSADDHRQPGLQQGQAAALARARAPVEVLPRTFYVYNETAASAECAAQGLCYHAEAWVAAHLAQRGFRRVRRWAQAEFIWTFSAEFGHNMTFIQDSQMVNHVGGVFPQLADKSRLFPTVQRYAQRAGCGGAADGAPRVLPFTADARDAGECAALLQRLREEPSHAWLLKPKGGSGGTGIQLFKSNSELRSALLADDARRGGEASAVGGGAAERCRPLSTTDPDVAQEYLDNPLLLQGTKRRKFNLRAYLLISSVKPFLAFMHGDGYAGSSMHAYNASGDSLAVHLTGMHTQAHEAGYDGEERVYTWDALAAMIESEYGAEMQELTEGAPVAEWLRSTLRRRLLWLLYAARGGLDDTRGAFNVLAVDLLLDSAFHLWVLEVNAYPWLAWETDWGRRWMHGLVTEMLDIQLEVWDAKQAGQPLTSLQSPKGWQVLANEDAGEALYDYNSCPSPL